MEKKNVNLTLLESFSDLLPEEIEEKTLQSLEWFRSELQATYLNQDKMNEEGELVIQAYPFIGSMVMFPYDAKTKKKLPYWDRFPVVIVMEVEEDYGSFQGLNLHYLPPTLRAKFLDGLMDRLTDKKFDEKTRFAVSYQYLKSATKLKYFKPCFKHYLTSNVRSRFAVVPAPEWEIATFLPTADWQKGSGRQVYKDSRNMI